MIPILQFIAATLADLLRIYVMLRFWGWFVVGAFVAVPMLTFWQMAGIYLLLSLYLHRMPDQRISDERSNDRKSYDTWVRIAASFAVSLSLWGCGWLVSLAL